MGEKVERKVVVSSIEMCDDVGHGVVVDVE